MHLIQHLVIQILCLVEYKKSSDDNTKTSGLSSQESQDISAQTSQTEKVNIRHHQYVVSLESLFFKILDTLASLGSQIRTCSEGFEDIKNRLIKVETSFHENLKEIEIGHEVK